MALLGLLAIAVGLGSLASNGIRNQMRDAEAIQRAKEKNDDTALLSKGFIWMETGEPCEYDYDIRTQHTYIRSKRTGAILKDQTEDFQRQRFNKHLEQSKKQDFVKIKIEGENEVSNEHFVMDTFSMEVYYFLDSFYQGHYYAKVKFSPENKKRTYGEYGYELYDRVDVDMYDKFLRNLKLADSINVHFPRDIAERREFFRKLEYDTLPYADKMEIFGKKK